MQDASICGLGQAAPNPMQCVMRYFPHEIWPEHFMTTQTIHDSRKLRFILDGEPVDAKAVTMMKEKQWQRSLHRRARTDYAGCFYLWSRAGSPQSDAMRDALHGSRKLRFILDGEPVDAKAVTMMKEKQWQHSLHRRTRTDYAGCFYLWSRAGSPQSDAMRDALFSP